MGAISKNTYKNKINNYISWFEIPALNIHRAVLFYSKIYSIDMETTETNGYSMAFFPSDTGIGGAVVMGEGCVPSDAGTLVYLNAGMDLSPVLDKIESNGGRVILEKTCISEEMGYFALFIDTEGNKLALHSKN